MSDNKLTGFQYAAKLMNEYGTTHAFFQEVMFRLTAKEAEKEYGIKFILAHSEGAAGYMADGYARIAGKPGIALAQSIGSANLVGGLQDAWLANAPVIAITGKKFPAYQYKNAYQEADHMALYEGMTKFNASLDDPQQLPFLLRQAYREASTGKPRPVHLDILGLAGVETEVAQMDEPFYAEPIYGSFPAHRTPADSELVQQAAALIAEAKKPLLVVGRGATVSGAGAAIYELATKCDIPIVTSPDGKTTIDETDPLWCGIIGGYGMDCANSIAMKADLVIFIGTQASDQTTCDWAAPNMHVKAIQIDIEPSELGKNYPNSVGLLGDARTVAEQLSGAVSAKKNPEWRKETDAIAKATFDEQEKLMALTDSPIRTEHLCKVLSDTMPDDAVLVADTGYSAIWTATMVRMKTTQQYIRAAGSLGWAFPASLGAKCAAGDRPVICFTGDGGFFYHLPEMETAIRHGIKTVTVINNNSMLSQCAPTMRQMYAERPQEAVDMISFSPVNFAQVAEQFGLHAERVESPAEIGPAIERALAADRAALVEVMTADDVTSIPLPALK